MTWKKSIAKTLKTYALTDGISLNKEKLKENL